MNILTAINQCREKAVEYLVAQKYEKNGNLFWRHSPGHDPEVYPGHLLFGTWAGVYSTKLLGLDLTQTQTEQIARSLNSFQQEDGTYGLSNAPESNQENHEYFSFHCSNYALGALKIMGQSSLYPLAFMKVLTTETQLKNWFEQRNWSNPWAEGNNVVNLASFYGILAEEGNAWASQRLIDMADWHDGHQNSNTGFWHADEGKTRRELINAMAGAAHNLHIYYYLNRDVPRANQIIDSCLRLSYMGIRSACIDIDLVDILVNFRHHNHRLNEIDRILEYYLIELLQIQNADGGFSDNYVTSQITYGYTAPAHVSVAWTTWFRLVTIAMITCALIPGEHQNWMFRNTLGMGYLTRKLRENTDSIKSSNLKQIPALLPIRLASVRKGRFLRQQMTEYVKHGISH